MFWQRAEKELPHGRRVQKIATEIGPLILPSQQLAAHFSAQFLDGHHAQRRAGKGGQFLGYRKLNMGEGRDKIDWRASARADDFIVQQRDVALPLSVGIWVDLGANMAIKYRPKAPHKLDNALILAGAMALAMARAGEQVSPLFLPNKGPRQPRKMVQDGDGLAGFLSQLANDEMDGVMDNRPAHMWAINHAHNPIAAAITHGLIITDYLADLTQLKAMAKDLAAAKIKAVLVAIIAPEEAALTDGAATEYLFAGAPQNDHVIIHAPLAVQEKYKERLAAHYAAATTIFARHGHVFLGPISSSDDFPALGQKIAQCWQSAPSLHL